MRIMAYGLFGGFILGFLGMAMLRKLSLPFKCSLYADSGRDGRIVRSQHNLARRHAASLFVRLHGRSRNAAQRHAASQIRARGIGLSQRRRRGNSFHHLALPRRVLDHLAATTLVSGLRSASILGIELFILPQFFEMQSFARFP